MAIIPAAPSPPFFIRVPERFRFFPLPAVPVPAGEKAQSTFVQLRPAMVSPRYFSPQTIELLSLLLHIERGYTAALRFLIPYRKQMTSLHPPPEGGQPQGSIPSSMRFTVFCPLARPSTKPYDSDMLLSLTRIILSCFLFFSRCLSPFSHDPGNDEFFYSLLRKSSLYVYVCFLFFLGWG